jgi:hypothetical protein
MSSLLVTTSCKTNTQQFLVAACELSAHDCLCTLIISVYAHFHHTAGVLSVHCTTNTQQLPVDICVTAY